MARVKYVIFKKLDEDVKRQAAQNMLDMFPDLDNEVLAGKLLSGDYRFSADEGKVDVTRQWIMRNAKEAMRGYDKGMLTLRGLHYLLVSRGMANTMQHYKRVVSAMIDARWDYSVSFETFSDHDRSKVGRTYADETDLDEKIDEGKEQIKAWMDSYTKNRWENQPIFPEVWIEKKALQGVFERVCLRKRVALAPCKGYPSLTYLYDAKKRFLEAEEQGKTPVILYFGDYDPSGEDIPRAIKENINRMGCDSLEVKRIALMKDQVVEWNLPPAPAKETDSRTASWDGLGQVELDAIEPKKLQSLCSDAIDELFDEFLYDELMEQQDEEAKVYRENLKDFVNELGDE